MYFVTSKYWLYQTFEEVVFLSLIFNFMFGLPLSGDKSTPTQQTPILLLEIKKKVYQ